MFLEKIGDKHLSDYTPEEDFILGTMLGYDRVQQCDRYLKMKNKNPVRNSPVLAGIQSSTAIMA